VITTKVYIEDGEDPNLGLDKFGDISIGLNELPIVRGGWTDRNGVIYQEIVGTNEMGSVNVVIDSIIPFDINSQILESKKNTLM